VSEVVDGYLGRGIGICQLPCPEQRAWGGVLKRRMLAAYGSAGTFRAPLARLLLRPFTWYTRRVYARLARGVTRDMADYQRSGVEVVGLVGVGGSPSCGVATTLDLPAAVNALTRCPAARLDRRTLNQDIIAPNVHPGEGLFIHALRQQLARAGAHVPTDEHDLLAELGIRPSPQRHPANPDKSRLQPVADRTAKRSRSRDWRWLTRTHSSGSKSNRSTPSDRTAAVCAAVARPGAVASI
jgi:hypothetical protein